MKGKHAGWQPNGHDPWRVLLLAVLERAIDDMAESGPDSFHALDPAGARVWLKDCGNDLLEVLDLSDYADLLEDMICAIPELQPGPQMILFDYERMVA